MWVIPRTLSAFVQDMAVLSEESNELASMLGQSVTVNGKLMSKQYWSRRLKKDGWIARLYGQMLSHSQQKALEEKWTASLVGILANRSVPPESEREKKTQDTYGPTSENTPGQLELDGFSQKMSRVTQRLDCPQSSAIWKKMVSRWRQEYSARKNAALLTEENASLSWATPQASDYVEGARTSLKSNQKCLGRDLNMWPSPRAGNPGSRKPGTGGKVLAEEAKRHAGLLDQENSNTNGSRREQLSPDWVESLMGLPIGTTDLGSWGTV
jgi:hypothetical protein